MNPHARLTIGLLGALVLWVPSIDAVVRGDLELLPAALRFVVAFMVLRIGLGLVGHLWHTYTLQTHVDDAGDMGL